MRPLPYGRLRRVLTPTLTPALIKKLPANVLILSHSMEISYFIWTGIGQEFEFDYWVFERVPPSISSLARPHRTPTPPVLGMVPYRRYALFFTRVNTNNHEISLEPSGFITSTVPSSLNMCCDPSASVTTVAPSGRIASFCEESNASKRVQ